jgi:VCBS repeat-containing protein
LRRLSGRIGGRSSVNDAAVIGDPSAATVTEDVSPDADGMLVATGSIGITDSDAGEDKFKTVVVGADGNLGTLTLADDGSYTYAVANSAVQHLGAGESKVDTFTVEALDGTTDTVSFTVNGANDPVQLGFNLIQKRNDGPGYDDIYIDNIEFGLNSTIL